MTLAATPEALAEALSEFQRRNGYHRPEIEELLMEFGELLLTKVVSALQQVTAERDEETRRANEAVIRAGAMEQERNHLRHHYDAAMAVATNDDLPADVKMTLAERITRYRERWLFARTALARAATAGEGRSDG